MSTTAARMFKHQTSALAWGDREADPVWEVELVLPISRRLRENGKRGAA